MTIDEEKYHDLRKKMMLISCELALVDDSSPSYHEACVNMEQAIMWFERGYEIEQAVKKYKKEHGLE